MKKKILDILIVIFAVVFIAAGVMLIKQYKALNSENETFENLKAEIEEDDSLPFDENSDMAAWLKVKGTSIDYPVMLTPDEPEKYLHLDFNGEYSYSGTPFIDGRCTLDSDNIIIYGHNMLNKTMFSTLSKYEDESFFKEHKYFTLETEKEKRKYIVSAAFKTDTDGADFIYNFIDAYDENSFNLFAENIRSLALYDTSADLSYGDELVTLSTCAYHVDNGRFIVIGKRIK